MQHLLPNNSSVCIWQPRGDHAHRDGPHISQVVNGGEGEEEIRDHDGHHRGGTHEQRDLPTVACERLVHGVPNVRVLAKQVQEEGSKAASEQETDIASQSAREDRYEEPIHWTVKYDGGHPENSRDWQWHHRVDEHIQY